MKRQVAYASQRAKILEAILKGGAPGAQGQAAPAARAEHFFQRAVDRRKIGKIEFALQVVWRQIVNQVRKIGQVKDRIDPIDPHHILQVPGWRSGRIYRGNTDRSLESVPCSFFLRSDKFA